MSQGIATSTRKVYSTAEKLFIEFCARTNRTPLPAEESTLILFVTELAQMREHSTIRSYLSGVRFIHITNGLQNPLENTPRLDLVLKGIRRVKPKRTNPRLPITPAVLRRLQQGLRCGTLHKLDEAMMWAACSLAFFGFLRSGEFTQESSSSYDPRKHLSVGDVAVDSHEHPSQLAVTLRSSKTDQFGQGVTITIGKTDNALCPGRPCSTTWQFAPAILAPCSSIAQAALSQRHTS